MKNLLVIDGNSILNRQYYGVRPLTTKSGLFTNAVYGFTKVIASQLEKLSADYFAVAFDRKEKTFRHEMYDAYKAGRRSAPEELLCQFPYAKRLVSALGGTVLELAGYEADDILGTVAAMAAEDGVVSAGGGIKGGDKTAVYILTGDRDSLQLIGEGTFVLLAGNNDVSLYDTDAFFQKYGVLPDSFADVKALMGDSSDNIPGVPGIGEKTALKLIAMCNSLEELYRRLDSGELALSPSVLKKLEEGRESAFMSKKLATIDRNVPLGISLSDIEARPFDKKELSSLFTELEFTSFGKLLDKARQQEKSAAPSDDKNTCSEAYTAVCSGSPSVSRCDAEGIPDTDGKPGSCQAQEDGGPLASSASQAASLLASPCAFYADGEKMLFFDGKNSLSVEGGLPAAREVFEKKGISFIVHDMKSLMHELSDAGVSMPAFDFDVMLAAYTLDASAGSYDMEKLCASYLSGTFEKSDGARLLFLIAGEMRKELESKGCKGLYENIEHPLADVLYKMEKRGFFVDRSGLAAFSEQLSSVSEEYMKKIYDCAGKAFNINSPKQLAAVLYEDLSLPVFKKTKSGYSTDAEVLEKLRPYSPIIDLITDYRQAVKFRSTYADALYKAADERGRVHTRFNQTVTATGRLSSTEPNLQNIPVRTELGRGIRRFFTAQPGCLLIDADYSQIELRILAALSGDEVMTAAFANGADIHRITASQVFGIPEDMVTDEMRKRAKAVNFGIVYGIGEFSLAADIGVSMKEAAEYIKGYKQTYRGVDEYLRKTVEDARKDGYVTTLFGRRRNIPELKAQKASVRAFGARVAMNSPIQGSAADIIKIAMINTERALEEQKLSARLILQVHDELIIEAAEEEAGRAAEVLRAEMESAVSLAVPLPVEIGTGKTWYDCK